MIALLSWKNVWRNSKRSLIIIAAIAFGVWGGLLAGAVMMGWGESMVNTAIDRDLGHIQLHAIGYARDRDVSQYIPDGFAIAETIRSMPGVLAVSPRTIVDGMASSPISTFGVQIEGVDPRQAEKVTNIRTLVTEGTYFQGEARNAIVVGRRLAERLNLKVRSKVVLSFQALDSTLVYAGFRVGGIFKSESSQFDESHVFVRQQDLTRLLGTETVVHEIAVRAVTARAMPEVLHELQSKYPGLSVQSWKDLAPEIAVTAEAMTSWSYVFVGIILMALIFGITNTMLMAVMERIRELGILVAVGMKKGKVFVMILLETIMLSLTGGLCGMVLGGATILLLGRTGIDFSMFASSMGSFGASTLLRPFLPLTMYMDLVAMIILAASVASTLPAWKAVHLNPSQAIRTY
jgi:putative ABC transport system permease protein